MILKLKNVTYKIPNGHVVYEDLNFELELGEFVGVLGKNGAGKTTLLDLKLQSSSMKSGHEVLYCYFCS